MEVMQVSNRTLTSISLQNIPSDSTKIRSVLGGWLYAYELPPPPLVPPTPRSDSPDEVKRQLKVEEVRRERALSIHKLEEEKKRAVVARVTFYQPGSHDTELESHGMESESHDVQDRLPNTVPSADDTEPGSHDEATGSHDMQDGSHDQVADMEDGTQIEAIGSHDQEDSMEVSGEIEVLQDESVAGGVVTGTEVTANNGLEDSDGFVFAVHRRNVSHYPFPHYTHTLSHSPTHTHTHQHTHSTPWNSILFHVRKIVQ